jgi:hypothetical protein
VKNLRVSNPNKKQPSEAAKSWIRQEDYLEPLADGATLLPCKRYPAKATLELKIPKTRKIATILRSFLLMLLLLF